MKTKNDFGYCDYCKKETTITNIKEYCGCCSEKCLKLNKQFEEQFDESLAITKKFKKRF